MKKIMPLVFAAALAVTPVIVGPTSAHAGDGAIAAGVAGGLLGGMLLGGALAQPHYYAPPPPPPVYYEAEPVYARHCYWTLGEPYWDNWSGRWHRPHVRVCE